MHYSSESVEALVEQFMKLPTIGRKTAQRLVSYVLKMPRAEVVEIARALVAVKDRVKQCSICYNATDNDPCPICASSRRDHSIICVVEDANDVMALERTHEYRGVYHVLGGVISPLDGIGPEDLTIRALVARVNPDFRKVSSGNGAHTSNAAAAASKDSVISDEDASSYEAAGPEPSVWSNETDVPDHAPVSDESLLSDEPRLSDEPAASEEDGPSDEAARSEENDAANQAAATGETTGSVADEPSRYVHHGAIDEVILALNPTVEGDTTAYYISQLLKPHGVRMTRIARGLPIGGDLEYADEATLSRALEGRSAL